MHWCLAVDPLVCGQLRACLSIYNESQTRRRRRGWLDDWLSGWWNLAFTCNHHKTHHLAHSLAKFNHESTLFLLPFFILSLPPSLHPSGNSFTHSLFHTYTHLVIKSIPHYKLPPSLSLPLNNPLTPHLPQSRPGRIQNGSWSWSFRPTTCRSCGGGNLRGPVGCPDWSGCYCAGWPS